MKLLAITSYFNPFQGGLRKQNYETFRKHLGVELLTVEWSPAAEFDLSEQDADYLVRVSGGDLLWQKERLLNIGLARAKELGASRVAFLDCDIVFSDSEWSRRVNTALNTHAIVQCFTHVNYLPPLDHSGMSREALTRHKPDFSRPSLAHELLKFGRFLPEQWDPKNPNIHVGSLAGNPGLAVAISLDEQPKWRLYDGNIVGGGDGVLMAAATNHLDDFFSVRSLTRAHQDSIRAWKAENFPDGLPLGCASNQIFHLWHGEIAKRKYLERHAILLNHGYDPDSDLEHVQNAALSLLDDKENIRCDIADYLLSREDF